MKLLAKLITLFLPCAFDATNMNRIQAGTCTLWVYKSADALATIAADDYFNSHTDELRNGDIILALGGLAGTETVDVLAVNSADNAASVTVVNGT